MIEKLKKNELAQFKTELILYQQVTFKIKMNRKISISNLLEIYSEFENTPTRNVVVSTKENLIILKNGMAMVKCYTRTVTSM